MTKLKQFGDLKPGDKLLGPNGDTTTVTKVYEKHTPERMYEMQVGDEVVRCSGNHMWYCESEEDRISKDLYENNLREYFETQVIPEKLEQDAAFPIDLIGARFHTMLKYQWLIERVALSLGHSVETPEHTYDGTELVGIHMIKRYSYNYLIDFLHQLKKAIIDGEGYFYFGQVRTTDEIFNRNWYNINIPTIGEIQQHTVSTNK